MKKQFKPVYFLKTNTSLIVDNRKLVNLLVHELLKTLENEVLTSKQRKAKFELSVSRFHLHNSLDIKGKIKFRISKVVNELNNNAFHLENRYKTPFFETLSLDKKDITFTLNPKYNQYLFDYPVFAIDQEIQRKITRKNTLFLYELCMSRINKVTNRLSDNEVMTFNMSFPDIIAVLGRSDYKDMRNVDIFRTVFVVSAKDLNGVEPGFKLDVKNNIVDRVTDSLSFELTIINADYINNFIGISQ